MPSSGLIDSPQDAKFYDWRLIDPKDTPLCVFRFHYRSWDSLESLQLIPPNYPRKLLPSSASILSTYGLSRDLQEKLRESDSDAETLDMVGEADDRSSIDSQKSIDPFLTSELDDTSGKLLISHDMEFVVPENAPSYPARLHSPTSDKLASAVVDKPISPESGPWKDYLDRPLPQVPTRRSSLKHLRRHSRKTSSSSTAPSITSSLRSYADRDTPSPEPEVRTADIALLKHHSSPAFDDREAAVVSENDYSPDKGSNSPGKSNSLQPGTPQSPSGKRGFLSRSFRRSASKKNKIIYDSPGPANGPGITPPPILLPNVTLRKTRNSPPKTPLPKTPLKVKKNQISSPLKHQTDEADDLSLMNTTTLSESEWMMRTPSPLKKPAVLGNSGNMMPSPVPAPLTARKIAREESGQLLDLGMSEHRSENKKLNREGSGQLLDLGMSLSQEKRDRNENRKLGSGSIDSKSSLKSLDTKDSKSTLRKKMVGWYSKDKIRPGETVDENEKQETPRGVRPVRPEEHEARMGGNWI